MDRRDFIKCSVRSAVGAIAGIVGLTGLSVPKQIKVKSRDPEGRLKCEGTISHGNAYSNMWNRGVLSINKIRSDNSLYCAHSRPEGLSLQVSFKGKKTIFAYPYPYPASDHIRRLIFDIARKHKLNDDKWHCIIVTGNTLYIDGKKRC